MEWFGRLRLRRRARRRGPRIRAIYRARVVTTSRLTLRPYLAHDAEDWYSIQSDPQVLEYLGWPVRSRRQSAVHLRHRTRHTVLSFDGDFLALAVVHAGQLIGDVSLHLRGRGPEPEGAEIGWILGSEWTGRGFAAEAAAALLEVAFTELGVRWVIAAIHPQNERSIRLAQRLRFEAEPIHRGVLTMRLTAERWSQTGEAS